MELFQWSILSGDIFEQAFLFRRFDIGVPDRGNSGLGFGLAVKKHVMASSNQKGTVRGPDRIGYTVRGQTRISNGGVEIGQNISQTGLTSRFRLSNMYPTLDLRQNTSFSSDISPLRGG